MSPLTCICWPVEVGLWAWCVSLSPCQVLLYSCQFCGSSNCLIFETLPGLELYSYRVRSSSIRPGHRVMHAYQDHPWSIVPTVILFQLENNSGSGLRPEIALLMFHQRSLGRNLSSPLGSLGSAFNSITGRSSSSSFDMSFIPGISGGGALSLMPRPS